MLYDSDGNGLSGNDGRMVISDKVPVCLPIVPGLPDQIVLPGLLQEEVSYQDLIPDHPSEGAGVPGSASLGGNPVLDTGEDGAKYSSLMTGYPSIRPYP